MSENPTESIQSQKSESTADDNCVVCFKNVEIYSIGECDHPVCYECSTRMRSLCQQNECPICRHVLAKVIFTYDKLPYRELEAKNRSEFYSKKYKISFYNHSIQQAFFQLLDHPCPKCNVPPYRTFQGLKNHVRKEHNLFYCDLCTENLKIFTFERRCYTQAELNLHRTKGDPDNRSHRGHPLCEYCNKRFLDRDELFRHLRREHYFCHFCDADGCNEFYRNYDALAEHFRQDHFLCEEGKCATEQFIGAFRTEIDYKAHVTSVHGKLLNKQQAKQTRTLQLEITLGPRGRSGQTEQGITSVRRSRGNEEDTEDVINIDTQNMQQNAHPINIDARNEQDFPSLRGTTTTPTVSLVRGPPQSMRIRSTAAGLARTKENFPALGESGSAQRSQNQPSQTIPMSSMIRKPPTSSSGAVSRITTTPTSTPSHGNGMIIHVSNRPTTNNVNGRKPTPMDFPALPIGKSKKQSVVFDEESLPSVSNIPMGSVSAKHRVLVDDYVSVASSSNFQKIKMVQKEETEPKLSEPVEQTQKLKLTSDDFPTLGENHKSGQIPISWVKSLDKKQRELESRKSKVAPAPILPSLSNKTNKFTINDNGQQVKRDKKNKDKKNNEIGSQTQQNKANGKKERNNNENKSVNGNNNNNDSVTSSTLTNHNDTASAQLCPPPGFPHQTKLNNMKPPPGFQSNVTLNSVAKLPNNLTFTSSLGESYSINLPTHKYTQPPSALTRNQKLVGHFKESLKTNESLEEFRLISQKFRDGFYKPHAYYEHCQAALKDNFDKIFPELLALLPDISKQQALYLVHTQRLNTMTPNERKSIPSLEVCSTCKQILLHSDADFHRKMHTHNSDFPTLGATNSNVSGKNVTGSRK